LKLDAINLAQIWRYWNQKCANSESEAQDIQDFGSDVCQKLDEINLAQIRATETKSARILKNEVKSPARTDNHVLCYLKIV
jgi:hypothetical protein